METDTCLCLSAHVRWYLRQALTFHCLPSRAAGHLFLRSTAGCIPGGAVARRIITIGIPKSMQVLPELIKDPMHIETSLIILARINSSQFLACPGSLRANSERPPEKSSVFYKEGIRLITIDESQYRPIKKFPCAPISLRDANATRPALKLVSAMALCMREIYVSEKERRHPQFDAFIDASIQNWPYEYIAPGKKLVIVWEDADKHLHVTSTPYLSEMLRLCSGATSGQ